MVTGMGHITVSAEIKTKPKLRQTEFWVQILLLVANIAGCVAELIPPQLAAILLAVQAAVYTWYRQRDKAISVAAMNAHVGAYDASKANGE